jgi:hypothetical protein
MFYHTGHDKALRFIVFGDGNNGSNVVVIASFHVVFNSLFTDHSLTWRSTICDIEIVASYELRYPWRGYFHFLLYVIMYKILLYN